jgi:ERCC4-type nuclease
MSKQFTIIRDTKEKKGKGWFFDYYKNTCSCISHKLDAGDYTIEGLEDIIMIERKGNVGELFMNLGVGAKNFWKKMDKLSKVKYPFLILEMSVSDIYYGSKYSNVSPNYVISCLMGIMMRMKINVIFLGSSKNNDRFAYTLLRKAYEREVMGSEEE